MYSTYSTVPRQKVTRQKVTRQKVKRQKVTRQKVTKQKLTRQKLRLLMKAETKAQSDLIRGVTRVSSYHT